MAPWAFVTRCDGRGALGLGPRGHVQAVLRVGARWGVGPVGICDPLRRVGGVGAGAPWAFVTPL